MKPLLVVRHVPWEGPHRILDAFPGQPLLEWQLSESGPLPALNSVCGAVFMGGPMSVNDTDVHSGLADEITWLKAAVAHRIPVLGICLGAQLLASALGATVAPGEQPEIGIAEVEIIDDDPLLASLAPRTHVLHWHGERFDLPSGATALARSALTPVQAFRAGDRAWGMLFHPEADAELVTAWLAAPAMVEEARAVLGATADEQLRADAGLLAPERARAVFDAFAAIIRTRGSDEPRLSG
jgi:GMP synthase (glutamine-hydrolysing)